MARYYRRPKGPSLLLYWLKSNILLHAANIMPLPSSGTTNSIDADRVLDFVRNVDKMTLSNACWYLLVAHFYHGVRLQSDQWRWITANPEEDRRKDAEEVICGW